MTMKGDGKNTCPTCGKKLSIFKTGSLYKVDKLRFCTFKCKNDYVDSEIGLKCRKCGKTWYFTIKDEKNLKLQAGANALIGLSMLGGVFGAAYSNKAQDTARQAENLRKCPNCGSRDCKEL